MVIFLRPPPIARNRPSGESAIEGFPVVWTTPSFLCVNVSQNVTVLAVGYAMDSPYFGRAMHEERLVSGTGHCESADPVDASNLLISLLDRTKRWLWNQSRPLLCDGDTLTGISTSKRPSLLSQTRTDPCRVAVAIRSPCGEYFAAITRPPSRWSSVCTCSRVAMSQTTAVWFDDTETSRVESGEKSTPRIPPESLCARTCSCVFASHTSVSPEDVPAAIHLPSFETARHRTSLASIVAICLPSFTRHTPTLRQSQPARYSPSAEKVPTRVGASTSISMGRDRSCPMSNGQHQHSFVSPVPTC